MLTELAGGGADDEKTFFNSVTIRGGERAEDGGSSVTTASVALETVVVDVVGAAVGVATGDAGKSPLELCAAALLDLEGVVAVDAVVAAVEVK